MSENKSIVNSYTLSNAEITRKLKAKFIGTLWILNMDPATANNSFTTEHISRKKIIITNFYEGFVSIPCSIQYYCVDTNETADLIISKQEARDMLNKNQFILGGYTLIEPPIKSTKKED